jgi:hypothetical protein
MIMSTGCVKGCIPFLLPLAEGCLLGDEVTERSSLQQADGVSFRADAEGHCNSAGCRKTF